MIKLFIKLSVVMVLIAPFSLAAKSISKKEFLNIAFVKAEMKPTKKTLWLNDELQSIITDILDHRYSKLRLRYWIRTIDKSTQTVWFLDEIGKERPITFGISIIDNRVSVIKVLAFRESRGGEIQMQAFTDQFDQIGLNESTELDHPIDGISGATMSVSAMKKITRVAISLHIEVNKEVLKDVAK